MAAQQVAAQQVAVKQRGEQNCTAMELRSAATGGRYDSTDRRICKSAKLRISGSAKLWISESGKLRISGATNQRSCISVELHGGGDYGAKERWRSTSRAPLEWYLFAELQTRQLANVSG